MEKLIDVAKMLLEKYDGFAVVTNRDVALLREAIAELEK